jgi:hypothetical protein
VELQLERPPALGRLLLHPRERTAIDDLQHALDAERADQLTLEIRPADVDIVENAAEEVRLVLVAEAAHASVGRKTGDEAADRLRAADRNDLDSFGPEIAAETTCEQLEDGAIARPFHGYE